MKGRKQIANISLPLISFADKQAWMDTFNYNVKISLKAEILLRCSGNFNNGFDIVNTGLIYLEKKLGNRIA